VGLTVLVVGSGGREHALVWKIAQSPLVEKIFAAPGNPGMAKNAELVPLPVDETARIVDFAVRRRVDLTVVGPEAPLAAGIADDLEKHGLLVCGPSRAAAQLEGSKVFTKNILAKYGIPTADFRVFDSYDDAEQHLLTHRLPVVIKADGLAAGKGVSVAGTYEDGETFVPLPSSQDHKRIGDGDTGPNTGGMGAYSPAPVLTPEVEQKVQKEIFAPLLAGMRAEGMPFRGILYGGLMIERGVAKVLEFNVRFGDPEAQPLFMRLSSDLVPLLMQCARGKITDAVMAIDPRPTVCIVIASGGYPGSYQKGFPITGIDEAEGVGGVQVFHAGTAIRDGKLVNSGGRVLGVTAVDDDIRKAIERGYRAVEMIRWEGAYYRTDIGKRALEREGA
jgi:phosphoribosylamine--glycine ligase